MKLSGHELGEAEFERCFRRIYQHYGSPHGYKELSDVRGTLENLVGQGFILGVTSNCPCRTVETTLPLLGLHDFFHWFACSEDVGAEKPEPHM